MKTAAPQVWKAAARVVSKEVSQEALVAVSRREPVLEGWPGRDIK